MREAITTLDAGDRMPHGEGRLDGSVDTKTDMPSLEESGSAGSPAENAMSAWSNMPGSNNRGETKDCLETDEPLSLSEGAASCLVIPDPPVPPLISRIQELWRQRQDHHRAEKVLTLQIKAQCRRFCRGDKLDAAKLYKSIHGAGEHELKAMALVWSQRFLECQDMMRAARLNIEDELCDLAENLPAYEWWCSVKGLGPLGLVAIVGEAGDLSNYATKHRLRKRMGIAVVDGHGRQRRVKDKALAELMGYSPARYSVLWTVGDSMFRHQKRGGVACGPYGEIYETKKADYTARVEAGEVCAQGHKWTKVRADKAARRYMTRRLLDDLWRAWREAHAAMAAIGVLPPATERGAP